MHPSCNQARKISVKITFISESRGTTACSLKSDPLPPMKTRTHPVTTPVPSSLLDSVLVVLAGVVLESQTRGELKPFSVQRNTLKTLCVRAGR